MKNFLPCLGLVLLSVSVASASSDDGKEIFEKKCNTCHTLERSLSKSKDLQSWEKTTSRMSRNSGGMITAEEAEEVAEYLADLQQAKKPEENLKSAEEAGKPAEKQEQHKMFKFRKVEISQFIDPEMCAACHSDIYNQWNGSMHSKAFIDPLWRAATKLFYKDAKTEDQILEMKACIKCHTPLGFRSRAIQSPDEDYDKLAELPAQGIFCNWCHNISEVKHIGDAGYEVEPGGGEDDPSTMLGPRKDAESPFHPTKYSELHTRSEFCGLCHNVSHVGHQMPIERTYDEWKNSAYNTGKPETTVNCQDCHMRQRPGVPATGKTSRPDNPGKACIMGPDRPHIWTHYFVGGNAVVTKLLGSDTHAQLAIDRLKNAADLKILTNSSYGREELSHVRVKVINSGAGHYLPTGLTEVREMWLDVKVTDAKGKVLLRSGEVDGKGNIDKNAVMYHTILGNEKGEPEMNVALADRVLYDYRVPPKGYTLENYAFYIPRDAVSPLEVHVTLRYRSASQELANLLLGKDAPEIPIIDMASITEKIEVRQ